MIRPLNALVAGCAGVIGYLMATGTIVPGVLILFLVVFLVTGAGNSINDYFDVEIDRINRPDRPLPSGRIRKRAVLTYATLLFITGVALSFLTSSYCVVIAVFNSLLLIFYAATLKKTPGAGNIAISYLSASIFLFGGAYYGIPGVMKVLPVALITFFAMLAREIWKDAEDIEGDLANRAATLPVIMGVHSAIHLGFAFLICAVAASLVPVLWWGPYYLAGITCIDLLILAAGAKAFFCHTASCLKGTRATTLIKYAMFGSLAVFTVSAILL